MIRTFTPDEALARTVRGDVAGVLDGWCGPVMCGERTERVALGREHVGDVLVVDDGSDALSYWTPSAEIRLFLRSPLVRAHLVGWLGRGERCPGCGGSRWSGTVVGDHCGACNGTGWLRPPHDRYDWLRPEYFNGLPEWVACALIWGSVMRVSAGMGPIRGHLDPWFESSYAVGSGPSFPGYVRQGVVRAEVWRDPPKAGCPWGWCASNRMSGPSYGDAGKAEADAVLLSEGLALLDDTPTGPVLRFEVPNE